MQIYDGYSHHKFVPELFV